MAKVFPRILACGDSALSVEFSQIIDEAVNAQVIGLEADLIGAPIEGVKELVPTYRSLMVIYDPALVRGAELERQIMIRLEKTLPLDQEPALFKIPVIYGGEAGPDLEELARMKGLTIEEVIALHSGAHYRVFMIGFAPGFAYLGGLPEILHTPRLAQPRQLVAANSIGIGGQQASINTVAGPSGWRFIGRTPINLFDPHRTKPFLLKAGDRVCFYAIDEGEAKEWDGEWDRR